MTEDIRCPICGSETVVRTTEKGPSAGLKFHVCTRYPKCKGKVPINEEMRGEEPSEKGEEEFQKSIPELLEALKDKDYDVRRKAAEVLGNIGRDAKAAVPALIEVLKNDDEYMDVCCSAAVALGKIGDEAAVPALRDTLNAEGVEDDVHKEAAEALMRIGGEEMPTGAMEIIRDKRGLEMERWGGLRAISTILKVLAWIVLAAGIFEGWRLYTALEPILSYFGGVLELVLLYGFTIAVSFIVLLALAYIIPVVIASERNSRRSTTSRRTRVEEEEEEH